MKNFIAIVALLFLLIAGFLYSVVQNQSVQIVDLQNQTLAMKKRMEALELLEARARHAPPPAINRPVIAVPNELKQKVFQALYTINGSASSENAALPKRIRYLPGQLIVQDLSVAKEDRFFDLLGTLLDEDAVTKIEIPARNRPLRKDLLEFGVSSDLLVHSKNGRLIVFIKNLDH